MTDHIANAHSRAGRSGAALAADQNPKRFTGLAGFTL